MYNRLVMIRLLNGTVFEVTGNRLVLETAGGVGYFVTTTSRFLAQPGDNLRLYTHLAVRETSLDLYGFATLKEVEFFELLLTLSGIGPKSALQILDQADQTIIIEALKMEDPVYLTKTSGLSKKTAEKIVLGLKDKIDLTNLPDTNHRQNSHYQDAFDTLVTLGYNPQSIRSVLDNCKPELSTSALVAEALRHL